MWGHHVTRPVGARGHARFAIAKENENVQRLEDTFAGGVGGRLVCHRLGRRDPEVPGADSRRRERLRGAFAEPRPRLGCADARGLARGGLARHLDWLHVV